MDIISRQACAKCGSVEKCVTTAMFNPDQNIKCVHFGYVTQQVNELIDTMRTQFEEYLCYLTGEKEN